MSWSWAEATAPNCWKKKEKKECTIIKAKYKTKYTAEIQFELQADKMKWQLFDLYDLQKCEFHTVDLTGS